MSVDLRHGNCLDILPTLPDCSVDSIVTDPPYELGFMGKNWDNSGIAYNITLWQECLRVLKPGGHLLAFGGTRTYHRMVVAIEDAGFEIRDSLHWIYGSGFPKSLDVSKAIDKQAGAEREVVGVGTSGKNRNVMNAANYPDTFGGEYEVTAPATERAKEWSGWGTALKPAHEPIVVARKPLVGTVAGNVLQYGTGALNIDSTRVGTEVRVNQPGSTNPRISMGDGWRNDAEPTIAAGRWPANIVFTHNHDCQQIGTRQDTMRAGERTANFGTQETQSGGNGSGDWGGRETTVPIWQCTEGCPVGELNQQSGTSKSGKPRNDRGKGGIWNDGNGIPCGPQHGDTGGASRFFTVTEWDAPFQYVAKPGKKERNAGLDHLQSKSAGEMTDRQEGTDGLKSPRAGAGRTSGAQNHHPTVKPLALMRWLVRLVTPPGGTVLEPFAGSGTTLVACQLEGFNAIGIEMTDEYLPIIQGRIAWAEQQTTEESPQQELEL